jgi:HSP20 family protein
MGFWGRNDPMALLGGEMRNWLDGVLAEVPWINESLPIWETEELETEFVMRAPLPGFALEEIAVTALEDRLTVRAEHRTEVKEGETPRERRRIERSVTLPMGIDAEHISAVYRNGMLEVHLPKVPAATPRVIPVNT